MSIRRTTTRTVTITEDIGLRFNKPFSQTGAQFRAARVTEKLEQTDAGWSQYTVEVSGPVVLKSGADSQHRGKVSYGEAWAMQGGISDIPREISGYLRGPDRLANWIALRGEVRDD